MDLKLSHFSMVASQMKTVLCVNCKIWSCKNKWLTCWFYYNLKHWKHQDSCWKSWKMRASNIHLGFERKRLDSPLKYLTCPPLGQFMGMIGQETGKQPVAVSTVTSLLNTWNWLPVVIKTREPSLSNGCVFCGPLATGATWRLPGTGWNWHSSFMKW